VTGVTFWLAAAQPAPATLEDELRAVATLASIALALLAFFTTRRAQTLSDDRKSGIGAFSRATVLAVLPELGLAAMTFGALAAMASLFADSWDLGRWTDRSHALESLFSIAYLGFAFLFAFQVGLVCLRLVPAVRNSLAARRA
jgi:hypothetical protein